MKKVINLSCIGLGFACIGLGTLGIVLPIVPTTPFFLLAAFLFAKSSKRFHKWFTQTKLYKKHLGSMVENKEMALKSKIAVLGTVSLLLAVGFLLSPIWHAKLLILVVAAGHFYYFLFRIKTVKAEKLIVTE